MSTTHDERPSGRHPVNIGHLVMGLALLGIVGIWALVQSDTVTGDDIRWLLPIPWVVAGAVGLTVTAVTGSRRYAVRQVGWVGDEPPETDTPNPSTDLTDLSTNLATDPSSNRSTDPSTDEETS
jgi:hypothetical protein